MTTPRQSVIVTRDYRPAPDNCIQALALLLKKSVRTKTAGPAAESNSCDTYEKLANEERSQDDLSEICVKKCVGDRTETT